MKLDKLQSRFVSEVVDGGGHVILTGKAGTGKSVALIHAVNAAKASGMDVLVMAPTAMAASIHRDAGLESGTIHHALRWNPGREPLPRKLLAVSAYPMRWTAEPDQNRLLIVDEASMVGLWLFEILARDLGDPERPFDGRRLVLVGDWAQLPPVVGDEEQRVAATLPKLGCFGPADACVLYHPFFRHQPPRAIILEETHRANGEWFEALNRLRDCNCKARLSDFGIDPRTSGSDEEGRVHMCFRRVTAHARNCERMARLPGRPHVLPLRDGRAELREGCEVIVTSNRAAGGYINGSRATFAGVNSRGAPLLDDGTEIQMLAHGNWGHGFEGRGEPDPDKVGQGQSMAGTFLRLSDQLEKDAREWLEMVCGGKAPHAAERLGDGRIVFQPYFPLLPGYALTVHKAQGMTLSGVVIEEDVFWNFAPARLPYVAMSRVADGGDVRLNGFPAQRVSVRPDNVYPAILGRLRGWCANRKKEVEA